MVIGQKKHSSFLHVQSLNSARGQQTGVSLVFWEWSVWTSAHTHVILTGFRGFYQSLQENNGIVTLLDKASFLGNPLRPSIHQSSCHLTLVHSLDPDRAVKWNLHRARYELNLVWMGSSSFWQCYRDFSQYSYRMCSSFSNLLDCCDRIKFSHYLSTVSIFIYSIWKFRVTFNKTLSSHVGANKISQ